MNSCYATDYSNRYWYLYESFKVVVVILSPSGQRRIVARPCSVGMRTCFDCPSVVSGREAYSCDSIHHSLVVCGTPVRIRGRKSVGLHDSLNDIRSTEILFAEESCGTSDSLIGQVGYDSKICMSP